MRKVTGFLMVLALLLQFPGSMAAPVTNADQHLRLRTTIGGAIAPKSVLSSNAGLVSAQNMMYRHSVTLYDAATTKLVATIKDTVRLSDFGYSQFTGLYQGSPVEAAFSPDGKYLYFTNYQMYGAGFKDEPQDECSPRSNYETSFLSRVNLSTRKIDWVHRVGAVPKVVRVTPNNKYILVANWCSYTVTVISVATSRTVATLKIGAYPRGMAVSSDSRYVFVAEMGGINLHRIDLANFGQKLLPIGLNPRAVVLSPDEKTIYVTLNQSGTARSWNVSSGKIGKTVKSGEAARSLDISSDGSALFVVNYLSDTVTKIRTSDMKIVQSIHVCERPIGITYEAQTNRTWVSCYSGVIKVFDNV